MRGEHVKHLIKDGSVWGSSPRARGTLAAAFFFSAASRIIPACAGNTIVSGEMPAIIEDHPRVRGEHEYQELMHRK